ncbi:kinase-like domain-containing protein [Rhizophagus clarus]|uniref:Kinase-like domain-containing protein n=1 Tax=Rhizophagus clarus TaxID=94130 RepID=A0A8H3LFF9_9GLOM|nr:kinase-like domain-containing protein [Rhizophagus clarus]
MLLMEQQLLQPKFKRSAFIDYAPLVNEEAARSIFDSNICQALNKLLGPDYVIERKSDYIVDAILSNVGVPHDSEHVCSGKDKVIRQIFTYMSEPWCKYGIISTYEKHWFLYRPRGTPSKLLISDPTVLEAYAYMIMQLCKDYYFIRSSSTKRTSSRSPSNSESSRAKIRKGTDLQKAPSHVLKEMLNEVEIYKILADIQGKCIPKLVCHANNGTTKKNVLIALESIHNHGVLHNDIQEENILFDNTTDGAYLIVFGMASCYHDYRHAKGKMKLFNEEKLSLSRLLDC